MNIERVRIYFDPSFQTNHSVEFGSLEIGSRVNISMELFIYENIVIIKPKYSPMYDLILDRIHRDNPLIAYLKSKPFKQTFFGKIFRLKPPTLIRNCHNCTLRSSLPICEFCHSPYSEKNFFLFAHIIDPSIPSNDQTYVTSSSLTIIKNSVYLVCQMVDHLMQKITKNAFCIIRPPGHLASSNKSSGHCLINNIAIGAEYAVSNGIDRVFIFDFGANHGYGTEEIFLCRQDVFYCSMHVAGSTGSPNTKGLINGQGFNLNIVVDKGIHTEKYLEIFRKKVMPAILEFNPQIILVSSGFDGLGVDPSCLMNLTVDCYQSLVEDLVKVGVPVGMVLEGGYNSAYVELCVNICIRALLVD